MFPVSVYFFAAEFLFFLLHKNVENEVQQTLSLNLIQG